MEEAGIYSIALEGDWSLRDFYEFPHTFSQVYALLYAFHPEAPVRDAGRLAHAFASYPWRGGYSAVNFYNVLSSQVPAKLRPRVNSIHYASPGAIELTLFVAVALSLGRVVRVVTDSAARIHEAYHAIYKGMHERRLLRLDAQRQALELSRDELKFVEDSSGQLARLLGFDDLKQLHAWTQNPVATLKILMSYYRRARILAGFQGKGKLSLPGPEAPPAAST